MLEVPQDRVHIWHLPELDIVPFHFNVTNIEPIHEERDMVMVKVSGSNLWCMLMEHVTMHDYLIGIWRVC